MTGVVGRIRKRYTCFGDTINTVGRVVAWLRRVGVLDCRCGCYEGLHSNC
jgi:hypothetical protein